MSGSDAILFEDTLIHEWADSHARSKQTATQTMSGLLSLSPTGECLAVMDASRTHLWLFPAGLPGPADSTGVATQQPSCFSAMKVPQPKGAARGRHEEGVQTDVAPQRLVTFTAGCWHPDGSRFAVAASTGHVYLLSKDGGLIQMVEAAGRWASRAGSIVGLALLPPPGNRLLLLTATADLFVVPVEALPRALAALRPRPLKCHRSAYGLAYHMSSSTFVVAGSSGSLPQSLSVSIWRWEEGKEPRMLHCVAVAQLPKVVSPSAAQRFGGLTFADLTIDFSPLGDHVLVMAPPTGLHVVSLSNGKVVDASQSFAGRPAPSSMPGRTGVASECITAAWWSGNALAMADTGGAMMLSSLPGYTNLLGEIDQLKPLVPGTLLACRVTAPPSSVLAPAGYGLGIKQGFPPGQRGIYVLEPVEHAAVRTTSSAMVPGTPPSAPLPRTAAASSVGWRLRLLAERSASQMLTVYVQRQSWSQALGVARTYGLAADQVMQAQWLTSVVSPASIQDTLANMMDHKWAVIQALQRFAEDYAGQRALLDFGLRLTARCCRPLGAPAGPFDDAEDTAASFTEPSVVSGDDAAWFRLQRVHLLWCSDRLQALNDIQGRHYDVAAYAAFRDTPLVESASRLAEAGALPALQALLQAHPALLQPHILTLLSRLPEELDPRMYTTLLPKANGELSLPLKPLRGVDWLETAPVVQQLVGHGDGPLLAGATDELARLSGAVPPMPSPDQVAEWYADRAIQIDAFSGQLQYSITLLEAAVAAGVTKAPSSHAHMHVQRVLKLAQVLTHFAESGGTTPSSGVPPWLVTLEQLTRLAPAEQLRLLLQGSSADTLAADVTDRALPFLNGYPAAERSALLSGLLVAEFATRPAWCVALVGHEADTGLALFQDLPGLVQSVITAIVQCPLTDAWADMEALLGGATAAVAHAGTAAKAQANHAGVEDAEYWATSLDEMRSLLSAGRLLSSHGLLLTVRQVKDASREEAARVFKQLLGRAQRTGSQWSDGQWASLWRDVRDMRSGGFPSVTPADLLAEYCRALCHAGHIELAYSYLCGAGGVPLSPSKVDALLVAVGSEILYSAVSMDDEAVSQAAECFSLATESKAAKEQLRTIQALRKLPSFGVLLLPAQLQQMPDRLGVLQLVLDVVDNNSHQQFHGSSSPGGGGTSGTSPASSAGGALGGGPFGLPRMVAGLGGAAGDLLGKAAHGGLSAAGDLFGKAAQFGGGLSAVAKIREQLRAAGRLGGKVALPSNLPVYAQLGALLELADLLGLSSQQDVLTVQSMAAVAAFGAGDTAVALELVLPLVAARHEPAWRLAADLGLSRHLSDDLARKQLLAFAVAHCPSDMLGRLLDELQMCERRIVSADTSASFYDAAPEYLLARALSSHPPDPPTAALPSLGDSPLALAALMVMSGDSAAAALRAHAQGDGAHPTSHAALQRNLTFGVWAHALRAVQSHLGLSSTASGTHDGKVLSAARRELLEMGATELLERARSAAPGLKVQCPDAYADVALAEEFAALLKAAEDCRTMKRNMPDVDASQFTSGGAAYQRQVILKQARFAGELAAAAASGAAAAAPGGGDAAAGRTVAAPEKDSRQVLSEATTLARTYGVDSWLVNVQYVLAVVTSFTGKISPEIKQLVYSHADELASRPSALLEHLVASTLPALPPGGAHQLALWCHLALTACQAMAEQKDDGQQRASVCAACAAGPLERLRDLLDKAGSAMRGLAVMPMLAPLLAALMQPLVPAASADVPDLGAAHTAAVAAIYQYVSLSNVQQAAKFIKAVHTVFTTSKKRSSTDAGGASSAGDSERDAAVRQQQQLQATAFAPVLSQLTLTLAYISLATKLMSRQDSGSTPDDHGHDDAEAATSYSQLGDTLSRLTPAQRHAWLSFLVLTHDTGGAHPAPVPPAVSGPLAPLYTSPQLKLKMLDDLLPGLSGSNTAGSGGGADVGVDAASLAPLQDLQRRLRALQLAQEAAPGTWRAGQLEQLEQALLGRPTSGSTDLSAVLGGMAAEGCHVSVLLRVAAALETQREAALQLLVRGVMSAAEGAVAELAGGGQAADAGAGALARLTGLVASLETASPAPAAKPSHDDVTLDELQVLRDAVWSPLHECCQSQDVQSAHGRDPAFRHLLELQGALGTDQHWSGWSGGVDPATLDQRRLFGATLAVLSARGGDDAAHAQAAAAGAGGTAASRPARDPLAAVRVTPDDLATCSDAQLLFVRLLAASSTSSQFATLTELLTSAWRDGRAWQQEAAEAQQPGAVSPLHECWYGLMAKMLEAGQAGHVIRLLESSSRTAGALQPMQEDEATLLVQAAAAVTPPLATCLGLLMPYSSLRASALHAVTTPSGTAAADGEVHSTCAIALLALLLSGDDECRKVLPALASSEQTTLAYEAFICPLASTPPHPATASGTLAGAGGTDGVLQLAGAAHGVLLPAVVARLCVDRRYGAAAALVAQRLRLHPALTTLGGGLQVLERYLQSVCRSAWRPPLDTAVLAATATPLALASLGQELLPACSAALNQLIADQKPPVVQ